MDREPEMTAIERHEITETGCTRPSTVHDMRDSRCTWCGYTESPTTEVHNTPEIETNERFEEIWEAEMLVRGETAGVLFAGNGVPTYRMDDKRNNLARARQRLYAMMDGLTSEEMQAYGEYRSTILADIASMSE